MANQFADFQALKNLKKELAAKEAAESPKLAQQQKKSHVTQLKSREEEHARNEGYQKGQAIRMMDTNDSGTITGFRKNCFEITLSDGLVITATKSEFVLTSKEEDLKMYRSMPSSPRKKMLQEQQKKAVSANEPLMVDLHIERIPGNENVPEWAALDFQMDYFRRVIRENLRHRGKKIVFVHGLGDGVLRSAVRRELDEVFALSCSYTAGTADNYGPGALIVTVR